MEREEQLNRFADEFLSDGGLKELKSEASGHWTALTKEMSQIVSSLRKGVARVARLIAKLTKEIGRLRKVIDKSVNMSVTRDL